jgi:hypothetical protein
VKDFHHENQTEETGQAGAVGVYALHPQKRSHHLPKERESVPILDRRVTR